MEFSITPWNGCGRHIIIPMDLHVWGWDSFARILPHEFLSSGKSKLDQLHRGKPDDFLASMLVKNRRQHNSRHAMKIGLYAFVQKELISAFLGRD